MSANYFFYKPVSWVSLYLTDSQLNFRVKLCEVSVRVSLNVYTCVCIFLYV